MGALSPYARVVLRKLGLFFAALALFSMADGQWAVLQTIAWTRMLQTYTQETGSMEMGLKETFDGRHPCKLCLRIAAAKCHSMNAVGKSSKSPPFQQQFPTVEKQTKAFLSRKMFVDGGAGVTLKRWASVCSPVTARDDQPPTPPPRPGCA